MSHYYQTEAELLRDTIFCGLHDIREALRDGNRTVVAEDTFLAQRREQRRYEIAGRMLPVTAGYYGDPAKGAKRAVQYADALLDALDAKVPA